MFRRNRFGITAAFVCHLLLPLLLVTSQLLPAQNDAGAPPTPAAPMPPSARGSEEVIIKADEQEKTRDIYKLRGNVEIDFRNLVVRGDEATYDASSGEVTATGHLVVDGGPHGEHITASHGQYNVRTETGRFYDVLGTSGIRLIGRRIMLTSSNPFTFSGKVVEKNGPDVYVVHHGMVTSCELPRPKWTLNAARIVVDLGGKARAYNSIFHLEKVPLFYLPYADHPVENLGRQTGFLLPNIGTSSRKGLILGDSLYWAISRSMDTTVGAEYFSKRGWAEHGTWRMRPTEDSSLTARYFGVLDRGFGPTHIDQGGEEVGIDGEAKFPYGFRGVLSADYLSSYLFRLAWGETFTQAVDSEVRSLAFLSRSLNGFSFNFMGGRYQNFQSTTPGDVVTILHMPSLEISTVDQKLGNLPAYWSFNTAAEGVSRKECTATTVNTTPAACLQRFDTNDLVGRYDLHPRASLPAIFRGWTFRPEIGLRETYYTQRLMPNPSGGLGTPVEGDVNRKAVEASFELRPPSLVRVFDHPLLRHKIKHAIEPRVVYRFVTGIDDFHDIIRFDSRDILSDTNEIEYGVIQRLYVKQLRQSDCRQGETLVSSGAKTATTSEPQPPMRQETKPCGPPPARELVSWELKQKYFPDAYFGGALNPILGLRNVFTTSDQFTGIAFLTGPRVFTPIVSRILVHPSAETDLGWQVDYDTSRSPISPTAVQGPHLNASTVYANYRLGDFFLGGSHTYFRVPGEIPTATTTSTPAPDLFNQFRTQIGYGNLNKRGINAAASIGFDASLRFLQYSAVQTSYNWDCCGLSFEYRRYALGAVRNENQFRFALSLANIGTFGNLKRQERIY